MAKAFNKGSKPAQLQIGLRNLRAKDSSIEVIENALKLIKSLEETAMPKHISN